MYKVLEIKEGKKHFSITEEADIQKLPKYKQNGDPDAAMDSTSDEACNYGSTALLAKTTRIFYLDIDNSWVELI